MDLPRLRKSKVGTDSQGNPAPTEPVPAKTTTKQVRPARDFGFGRRLAFTIDDDSIQMAAAKHLGPCVRLLNVNKTYFSSDEKSGRNMLRRTISEYVRKYGGRRPSISLTLTGPQTALRTVTVPRLKSSELQSTLGYEARRQVPFPAEDCWIDYRVTDAITRGGEQHLGASIFAATKLAVEDLLAPFEELGLEVDRIYHTQDVIGQLLGPLADFKETSHYALIDIHRRSTEISYHRGCNLEFYHVSSLGSSFLANRSDPTVFEYFAESLATEIQNSLDYYGGQFSSSQIQEIFIYGDLSYTDELISLLSNRFGLRFRRFPIDHLDFVRDRNLPFENDLSVCLPAVAAAVNQAQIANLLPTQLKQRRSLRRVNSIGVAAMMLLASLLIAHWITMTAFLADARDHLAERERQAAEFRASEMFATYNHLKRKLAANQSFMAKTREEPSYLGLNLKELSSLVPSAVRLYDLEFNANAPERNYLLSGLITTRSTPPELVLAEMVENLIASPFYENVIVEPHVKRRRPEEFVLDFSLSMRGII